MEGGKRWRAVLREVAELPSKVSDQQSWELRPPPVLLIGRRWLQFKQSPSPQPPRHLCSPGPGQGTR